MANEMHSPALRPSPLTRFLLATTLLLSTVACSTTTQSAQVAPAEPAAEAAPADQAAPAKKAEPAKKAPAPEAGTADKPADDAEEKTYNNTIKWTTASELDNFGFDVFRGDSAEGPFKRLNAETIEGAGTSDEPHNYRFVDDTIDPYRAYFYYVESISMSGEREKFTPVGRAKPKLEREAPEGAEDAEKADG